VSDVSSSISQQFAAFSRGESEVRIATFAQWAEDGDWRLRLAHDAAEHLLIWFTAGQGRVLLDGHVRGLGVHSALFVPARNLMAFDLARQAVGHVLVLPVDIADTLAVPLPQVPVIMRQHDRQAQTELTALLETITRERARRAPHWHDAVTAQAGLTAIWLHRQIETTAQTDAAPNAAQRLMQAYFAALCQRQGRMGLLARDARELGVTPTHLSRVCRAQTGRTAAALASEVTLHRARRLLLETSLSVQDIARFLGFRSASYFTQILIRHTGQSATALRAARRAR